MNQLETDRLMALVGELIEMSGLDKVKKAQFRAKVEAIIDPRAAADRAAVAFWKGLERKGLFDRAVNKSALDDNDNGWGR